MSDHCRRFDNALAMMVLGGQMLVGDQLGPTTVT